MSRIIIIFLRCISSWKTEYGKRHVWSWFEVKIFSNYYVYFKNYSDTVRLNGY